ncbi:MAG: hypothetical protein LC732_01360, partial [Acidobacteria bacterium]|nr:hypothetical protein [Acidobacteriota bacterium]
MMPGGRSDALISAERAERGRRNKPEARNQKPEEKAKPEVESQKPEEKAKATPCPFLPGKRDPAILRSFGRPHGSPELP